MVKVRRKRNKTPRRKRGDNEANNLKISKSLNAPDSDLEAAYEDYMDNVEEASTATAKSKRVKTSGGDSDLESDEEVGGVDWESEIRHFKGSKRTPDGEVRKELLPIRQGDVVIPQETTVQFDPDLDNVDPVEYEEKVPVEPKLSAAQLFAKRKQEAAERRQQIAVMSVQIQAEPQLNMAKLKQLRVWLENTEQQGSAVRRLLLLSLTELFTDILPSYRIRLASEKERSQKSTKDTKQLRDYEEALLANYKRFLQLLEEYLPSSISKIKFAASWSPDLRQQLSHVAAQCFCRLVRWNPEFNFAENIIKVICPLTDCRDRWISEMVCDTIGQLLHADRKFDYSLVFIQNLAKLVRVRSMRVQPQVVRLFLKLRVRQIDRGERERYKEARRLKRMKFKLLSNREKRQEKELAKVERQMEAAGAKENEAARLHAQTQAMEAVFAIYFRVLKSGCQHKLLSCVLEGLAKFAHLMNVDFYHDLFRAFNGLLESGELSTRQSLHCIQAAFNILSEEGEALMVDPVNFYRHLYGILMHPDTSWTTTDFLLLLKSLNYMFIKRRKQVSNQRLFAYFKRLATMTLHQDSAISVCYLSFLRQILVMFPGIDRLFDVEVAGGGAYLAELEDPEHACATNTSVWELATLTSHADSQLGTCVELMLKDVAQEKDKASPFVEAVLSQPAPAVLRRAVNPGWTACTLLDEIEKRADSNRQVKVDKGKRTWVDVNFGRDIERCFAKKSKPC